MKSKIKILVRPGLIRNRQVWLLYFLYNEKLNSEIKLEFKAQWSPELKCWWIDYRDSYLHQLKTWDYISIFKSDYIYKDYHVILNKRECHHFIKRSKIKLFEI
jgi:hypothetical protein